VTYSHRGTCSFCGSNVSTDFRVCKNCNASWQEKSELGELIVGYIIFGIFAWGLFGLGALIDSGGTAIIGMLLGIAWALAFFGMPMAANKAKRGQHWYR